MPRYPASVKSNLLCGKAWQAQNHNGFIKSFISTARYGPISKQHRDWERVGEWLSSQKTGVTDDVRTLNSRSDEVLILLGKSDPVILCEELQEDATEVLGAENVRFEILDTGHELPITKSEEIIRIMLNFWSLR